MTTPRPTETQGPLSKYDKRAQGGVGVHVCQFAESPQRQRI